MNEGFEPNKPENRYLDWFSQLEGMSRRRGRDTKFPEFSIRKVLEKIEGQLSTEMSFDEFTTLTRIMDIIYPDAIDYGDTHPLKLECDSMYRKLSEYSRKL